MKTDAGEIVTTKNPNANVRLFAFTLAFFAFLLGVGAECNAQKIFKKGDKIMASPTSMADEKYWRPCVITDVRDFGTFRGYDIECSAQTPGGSPSSFFVNEQWVKSPPVRNGNDNPNGGGENGDTPGENPTGGDNGDGQFKVGDRVEVDIAMMADPKNSNYSKATINEIDLPNRSIVVTVDPLPGNLPKQFRILIRDYGKHWIRPIRGADNIPKVLTEKLRTDENGTVLANRGLIDCENFAHSGKNGGAPPTELLKKLIRCLLEKPSQPGMDGAMTMDITGFAVGAPRRWEIYRDIGQGNANTLVYPIRVVWNQKTFYRTRNEQRTGVEGMYSCFVDKLNLWQCGHADGPNKDGKIQQIVVTP